VRHRDVRAERRDPGLGPLAQIGTTRSRVNFFLNKFRKLGFIEYDATGLTINPSLLTIVVHD
jgi:CRP/FNR family transcriptional regulator, cyclic AMP receptor protein